MKLFSMTVAASLVAMSSMTVSSIASADVVLNFDDHSWGSRDLPDPRTERPPARVIGYGIDGFSPDNYHGFDWNNGSSQIAVINTWMYDFCHPGSNIDNGSTSGDFAVFNTGPRGVGPAMETQIDSAMGAPKFNFVEANWTTFGNTDFTLNFEGWRDGVQVYTSSDYTISGTPTLISLNWDNIDSFRINASQSRTWIMDDFTVSAVPEPSTYALMLGGLGLVGLMAARRKTT